MSFKQMESGNRRSLVLTRRVGEAISIDGGRLFITVVRVKGAEVRLMFSGDRDIKIDREEVLNRTKEQTNDAD